ncbi:alpha-aminoadipic semialdehyde synthase, mitochondrial-like [Haliotis asinina]|uniref:alpha-aminoadipic semialdehyde synthase, mitochondrial-like n=1 Tax=Haliotis asinina TaxID=109174 RepID=UPI003531A874
MSTKKRVLVLGAGRVTGPLFDDLRKEKSVQVTVVNRGMPGLERAGKHCPGARLECVDVEKVPGRRDSLIAEHDLVISCLPPSLVHGVVLTCLAKKKNLVATNFCSPEQRQLHQQVVDADLIFLMDIGLRPGLDHMAAKQAIDGLKSRGGEITSYEVYTAAIPTPESANNPLKFKFSWCSEKALAKNVEPTGYMEDGKTTIVSSPVEVVHEVGQLRNFKEEFEAFYNHFDTSYLSLYGIENAHTLKIGSMRYKGFCAANVSLIKLGLYSTTPHKLLHEDADPFTWRNYMCYEFGLNENVSDELLESKVNERLAPGQIEVIRSLGLLGAGEVKKNGTPFKTLVQHLASRPDFQYNSTNRDMALMDIKVTGRFPDGHSESRKMELTVFGDAGDNSAISKAVGHCAATAAMMILNGEITLRGILAPVVPELYEPMLNNLQEKGIKFVSK